MNRDAKTTQPIGNRLLTAARSHEASLIVIGSHGFSGIDHLLGTTAARVVNHADRSVLIVRGADLFAQDAMDGIGCRSLDTSRNASGPP